MKNRKLIILCGGLIILVGVLFVWLNEQERRPTAAATPLAFPLPYITPSPIPTRDPALVPASYYTVDEVWAQAESLNGQHVAVRGWTRFVDESVKWECIDNCDGVCSYKVFIHLVLEGENQLLGIDTLTCKANNCCTANCSLTCNPFDPRGAIAYELVGTVAVYWQAEDIAEIHLTDVDVVASSRLIAPTEETTLATMARLPIETGRFSFPRSLLPQPKFLYVPTPTPTPDPVILYSYLTQDVASLDPQWAVDKVSQDYVENLFVQLTNYEVATGEIVPDAAASWHINATATVYTFTLHPNIPWVNHDPLVPGTTQVTDASGQPRFVTAQDFVYGLRRACDPANETPGAKLVAQLLKGCAAARAYPSFAEIPAELWQAIGVTAWDKQTLVIELTEPSAQFLAMTTLGILSAVPQWVIEDKEWGEYWTESGTIVTSGRFVLTEWVHNVRMTLLRNPLFPPDLTGTGNIAQVSTILVQDHTIGYALWSNGQVELATIPEAVLEGHLAQYEAETEIIWVSTGFPFDPRLADAVYVARHEWLTNTPNPYGAEQWYNWSIDGAKQAAARLP